MRGFGVFAAAVLAVFMAGCAHYSTVEYPPAVELRNVETVGILQFEVPEGDPKLGEEATHRFIATVQRAQPGTRVLELGTQREVLAKIGARELNPESLQAIGRLRGVDAVLSGSVLFRTPRTGLNVNGLTSVSTSVKVDASMKAALHETGKGALLWTNGASGTWNVGGVTASLQGVGGGMADPVQKHAEIMGELVQLTTQDFRPTFGRQRID